MTEALFTLTGNLGTLIGSSATRSAYVETAAKISNPTDAINYSFPIFKSAPNGVMSIQLPANNSVNLPYTSPTAPQFGFTITIGKTVWTVPAQAVNTTHDLSEFTTPFAAPVTTDSTAVDSINASLLANANSSTRTALDARYISEGGVRWDLSRQGVPIDGVTLADTALDTLLAKMKAGDILDIPANANIKLAARHDITKAITIEGNGCTFTQASTTGVFRVLAGGSGSKFRNFNGVGPSGVTFATDSTLILLQGTLGGTYVEDIELRGVTASAFGRGTLSARYARKIRTYDVLTKNCGYVGQEFLSCEDIILHNPMCDTLQGIAGADSYPVTFSNDDTAATQAPRTKDAKVFGGWARNTTWEALDCHGAQNVKVYGYDGTGTRYGIAFVSGQFNSVPVYEPLDCWAFGCTVSSGVSDGSARDGFQLAGISGGAKARGGFVGCTSIGYGNQADTAGAGSFRVRDAIGPVLSSITSVEPSPYGVVLAQNVTGLSLSNYECIDPWSNTTAATAAVGIIADNQSMSISDVKVLTGSKTATNLRLGGIRGSTGWTNTQIMLGGAVNFGNVTTPFVNVAPYLRSTFFGGVPVALPSLPAAGVVTAADMRAWAIGLGLAQ